MLSDRRSRGGPGSAPVASDSVRQQQSLAEVVETGRRWWEPYPHTTDVEKVQALVSAAEYWHAAFECALEQRDHHEQRQHRWVRHFNRLEKAVTNHIRDCIDADGLAHAHGAVMKAIGPSSAVAVPANSPQTHDEIVRLREAVALHARTLDDIALGKPDDRHRDEIDNELYNAVRAGDPKWWDARVPGLNGSAALDEEGA